MASETQRLRMRLARRTKAGASASELADIRADLKRAAALDRIGRIVDTAPPLTDAQRARLRQIFAPAVTG